MNEQNNPQQPGDEQGNAPRSGESPTERIAATPAEQLTTRYPAVQGPASDAAPVADAGQGMPAAPRLGAEQAGPTGSPTGAPAGAPAAGAAYGAAPQLAPYAQQGYQQQAPSAAWGGQPGVYVQQAPGAQSTQGGYPGYPNQPHNPWASAQNAQGANPAPSAGKRKAARWGIAAGILALAVTMGAVPGWALGHQAGVTQASGQSQVQQGNQNQNSNPFGQSQDGSGSNGSNGSNGGSGSDGSGSDGSSSDGSGSNGQQFQRLPFGDYGNGQGGSGSSGQGSTGNNSSVTEGTKLDSGQDGMVLINTELSGGSGAGTGMILSADGTVLTNYHVVEGSTSVKVTDSTTGKSYTADVIGHDQTHDVALLKLRDASGLKTVQTASGSVSAGDTVHAVGNASGEGYLRKLTGKVTATDESITTQAEATTEGEKLNNLIETDADVVPGYSGGALVNDAGQVVGMTTAASSGNTSATVDGYAIPISEALSIAQQIESGQASDTVQIGRGAALGISILSADSGQVGGGYGVTVNGLVEGGAAADSGIKAGDTIIGLDGKSVRSYSVLKSIIAGHKAGDKVEVIWIDSAGKQQSKTITLGESTVN